jgi:hypothetical protein
VQKIDLAPTGPDFHRLDDWCPEAVATMAASLHRRWRFDAVLCNYVWFSRAFEGVGADTLKIIDTHDIFAERHARLREAGVAPAWFSTSTAEEDRGLARADMVLAIQPEEAAAFRARGHGDVRVLGHLLSPRARLVRDHGRGPITAGYFASGNPLNHAAFTALRADLPSAPRDTRLIVAGAVCDRLTLTTPFAVMGRVDNAQAFYEAVDLALNPMAGGTGLKIKSVEALAQGVPLLATRAAMTGLPSYHMLHRLNGPAEAAACLRETRFGVTLRRELAEASRRAAGDYAAEVRAAVRELVDAIGKSAFGKSQATQTTRLRPCSLA